MRYVVNGYPMVKQGWAHGDNVRAQSMVVIGVCGGGVDRRRESACRRHRRACRGGQKEEPRGGLPNL